jgi:hypothetical protein
MAKITDITPTGVWNDLHKFDVSMDDGSKGTTFAKTSPPWYSVGDEVEYTINPKGGMKISKGTGPFTGSAPAAYNQPSAPAKAGSFGNKDEQIARSVAFKGAIDLAVAGKISLIEIAEFVAKHTPTITGQAPQGDSYKEHFQDESPF